MTRGKLVVVLAVLALVVAALVLFWPRSPPPRPAVPQVFLYVNDLATPGALLAHEEAEINDVCFLIDDWYTAEVAVLVVNTTEPLDIDRFAFEVFDQNGIGKAGYDNGVLVLVEVDTKEWRVEVGYGLEGFLTDGTVGRIGRTYLEPALSAGDLHGGLLLTVYEIGIEIEDNYVPVPVDRGPEPLRLDWWPIALPVVIFMVVAVLTRGRVFLWIGAGIRFRRGGFSGGRSGGGGARGRG